MKSRLESFSKDTQYLKYRFFFSSVAKLLKGNCCIKLFFLNLIKLSRGLDSANWACNITNCCWLIIEEREKSIWDVNIKKKSSKEKSWRNLKWDAWCCYGAHQATAPGYSLPSFNITFTNAPITAHNATIDGSSVHTKTHAPMNTTQTKIHTLWCRLALVLARLAPSLHQHNTVTF